MSRNPSPRPPLILAAVAAAALAGCGGGGTDPGPTPPDGTAVQITGKAVDGPLQGAQACYDLNDNGACDGTEPTAAPTDAGGNFALTVLAADGGLHRTLVQVPATAVDADTGAAVGTAFTLQAPATGIRGAHSVVVSPLSALVQSHMDATGASLDDAIALVQAQAGLQISPLEDFTAASSAAQVQAAHTARLLQATLLGQQAALAGVVGQTDLSGTPVSDTDVAHFVTRRVLPALPAVAASVADPAIAAASGSALTAAIASAAQVLVTRYTASPAQALASIGIDRLPATDSGGAVASQAALAALSYTNAETWRYRILYNSAADSVAGASGHTRYYDLRQQSQPSNYSTAGIVTTWGYGTNATDAGTLHWNGTDWAACTLGERSSITARDAQGRVGYDYCDGAETGLSTRRTVDLSGLGVAAVVQEKIRSFPGGSGGVSYSAWGPADLASFGSATFPAGSQLQYITNTTTAAAILYDVQASDRVMVYDTAIAAGGDARSTSGLACAANPLPAQTAAATLEAMIASSPGKPCIFNQAVSGSDHSLDPNEWWSNSTLSLGSIAGGTAVPAGTGAWYTTELRLRVGFDGGNATSYYQCYTRAGSGSSRNCAHIGTGTYTIETLGDARVMSFQGLPALVDTVGFTRHFIERSGQVWYGSRSAVGVRTDSVRLNEAAARAVFSALPGLPPVRAVTAASDLDSASQAAMNTLRGAWAVFSDTSALLLRVGDGGRMLEADALPASPTDREQSGTEVGWISYDATTRQLRSLLETDSNQTEGTSHIGGDTTFTIADDRITASTGTTLARMPTDPNGIVGLWAVGSASDTLTQHVAFFPNGKVLLADPVGDTSGGQCTQDRQGPPGTEFASYTYDAATGQLYVFDKLYDTNGCAGIFDSSPGAIANGSAQTDVTFTVTLSAGGTVATIVQAGDSPTTLYRVAPR